MLLSSAVLVVQTPTAVVNGTIVDTSGATVPDARVTVTNQDTNIASIRITGTDGSFTIINLLPGRQLTANSMFFVGYVGSHTERLEWCCSGGQFEGEIRDATPRITSPSVAFLEVDGETSRGINIQGGDLSNGRRIGVCGWSAKGRRHAVKLLAHSSWLGGWPKNGVRIPNGELPAKVMLPGLRDWYTSVCPALALADRVLVLVAFRRHQNAVD